MDYYKLKFLSSPAEEGELFRYKSWVTCIACGLRHVPYASDFAVPEDQVESLHLGLWEISQPIFEAAGLLIVSRAIASAMENAGLKGFRLQDAPIQLMKSSDMALPEYKWAIVTGRCITNDVWDRVVSVCSKCGTPRVEPIVRQTREVILRAEPNGYDLCRSRERAAGIIVSERFKALLAAEHPEHSEFVAFRDVKYG